MRIIKISLIFLLLVVSLTCAVVNLTQTYSDRYDAPTISCPEELLELSVEELEVRCFEGITAWDPQDGDLSGELMVQGISKFVDNEHTVKISYIVFDSDGNLATATRELRLTDYESPQFRLSKALLYTADASLTVLDRLGAVDCVDGDISGDIRVSTLTATDQPEIYTMDVQVTNSLGDTARITLPVVLTSGNTSRPVVELTDYLVYLSVGDSFHSRDYLSGVTAVSGGTGLADVEISGTVDTTSAGTYMVYYQCTDSFGTGTAVLTVVVEGGTNP